MPQHYLIFIHGIGERPAEKSSDSSYDELWNRIIRQSNVEEEEFRERFSTIYTNWHIDPLQEAAQTIYKTAFNNLTRQTINPMRGIRSFITFFLGDAVAYVSEDVNFIRRTVWQQIWEKLRTPLMEEGASYSLVAHSLGAIIAFDYLFHLFTSENNDFTFVPKLDPVARPEDNGETEITVTPNEVIALKRGFRNFFSMGAPIGLFMMRKGSLWAQGSPFSELINPVQGENCSWYNFWDSEDAIAYPLSELFGLNQLNNNRPLVDVPVETGFLIFDSHTRYWFNNDVAKKIAQRLSAL